MASKSEGVTMAKSQEKYEIEDGARTLIRAEEIRANKQLYKSVKRELIKQQKAVTKAVSKSGKK